MIRVLRIINRYNLGGPVYNAAYLSAHLGEEFETILIGGEHEENEGDAKFIIEKEGVNPIVISDMQRALSFSRDRQALKAIRQIIKEFKPHIVHTHASKAGALGRRAAKLENVPIIVHTFHGHVFHNYFGKLKTEIYKRVERKLATISDRIVAISEIQKKELSSLYKIAPKEKFSVIPLGFDLKRFNEDKEKKRKDYRGKHNISSDTVLIGIIGRLVPIKNHILLFDALKLLGSHFTKKVILFVIGDGELRKELEMEAQRINGLYENLCIQFQGWEKNVDSILPGFDLICLSSLNEGTPVSLIEAQASSVPVISTNVGGVMDVVSHGNTGLVIDSFEVSQYAEGLRSLIEDQKLRLFMSQNGWNFVEQRFGYKRLCQDMAKLYHELLIEKGIEK